MNKIMMLALCTFIGLNSLQIDSARAQQLILVPSGNGVSPTDNVHSVLGYDDLGDFVGTFIESRSGGLRNPRAVVIGPDGNVYVTSTSAGVGVTGVLRYNGASGEFIDLFAQYPGVDPFGLAFGPDGNLYVTNFANNEIVRFNGSTGEFIDIFVGADGDAPGRLSAPRGMVFDHDGNLYVANPGFANVLRYNGKTGAFMGVFASGVDSRDLVFGPDRNLYVSSFNNDSILRFRGTTGQAMNAFVVSAGDLDGPVGLGFGEDGNLYVGSFNNHSVVRYNGKTGNFMDVFVSSGEGGLNQPRIFAMMVPIAIDIQPLTYEGILSGDGFLLVTVRSSETFDATRIDRSSLRLAGAPVIRIGSGPQGNFLCQEWEVDSAEGRRDRLRDLVCLFKASELKLEPGAETAVLTGKIGNAVIRGEGGILAANN
jgi:streptogramin lyase